MIRFKLGKKEMISYFRLRRPIVSPTDRPTMMAINTAATSASRYQPPLLAMALRSRMCCLCAGSGARSGTEFARLCSEGVYRAWLVGPDPETGRRGDLGGGLGGAASSSTIMGIGLGRLSRSEERRLPDAMAVWSRARPGGWW